MYLTNGFKALATFGFNPALQVRVKEIQWPEIDGGGPIDTTVMHNKVLYTNAPKALFKVGSIKLTVQYDPVIWTRIFDPALNAVGLQAIPGINSVGIINVPTTCVLSAPDSASLTLYIYINKFTPAGYKIDDLPMADMELIPTNVNPNANVTGTSAHDVLPTAAQGFLPNRVVA